MSGKLYNLMNWPDIEGVVYSECDAPYELLGGHLCKDGFLIQAFRPDAVEMSVKVEGRQKSYPMEKVDEAGYFAALIPVKKKVKYMLTAENVKGKKQTYADPYGYEAELNKDDIKRFTAGTCKNAYEFMGSHTVEIDGVKGIRFAVWAPNAVRVSIVGDFNRWDGRILQMNRLGDSGIFVLFVPQLEAGVPYCYELKFKNGMIGKKLDPYSCDTVYDNGQASVTDALLDYQWNDKKWKHNPKDNCTDGKGVPVAICEMTLDEGAQEGTADRVCKMGFNYVKLALGSQEVVSYYAISGGAKRLQKLVDTFHGKNIGVLVDWQAAYFSNAQPGLSYFDGAPTYEMNVVRLGRNPEPDVSTFDYAVPQVRTFLYSNICYLAEKFHIDGVVIDEVASMLYLDYGRSAGEWIPNIYGGNENIAAEEFIKGLRKLADKRDNKLLLIAQESSAWSMVTGDVADNGLGFDYKLNDGWKKEIVPFMGQDPLFRKGIYGRLTYSILYQYSENFILDYSRVNGAFKEGLKNIVPGCSDDEQAIRENKTANVKVALAYMYTHPGKKLVNIAECEGLEDYIAGLNGLYLRNQALYEQDGVSDGFEWIDNESAEESVLAYVRRADDGTELMAVLNFTPVERKNFRFGVTKPGKYNEIFNSADGRFVAVGKKTAHLSGDGQCGGNSAAPTVYESDDEPYRGMGESISVNIPPLGAVVYEYAPYTKVELEIRSVKKNAVAAKKAAEEEARLAEDLKIQAAERVKAAKEAEEAAKKSAKEAVEAQKKAEKKAAEAEEASRKIDEETKKKLGELMDRISVDKKG